MLSPLRLLILEDCQHAARPIVEHLERGGYVACHEVISSRDQLLSVLGRQDWEGVIASELISLSGLGPGRFFERALEAMSEGVVLFDAVQADTPIIYVNAAMERLTGYARCELVGRNCCVLHGKDTDQEVVATIMQAIRDQRAFDSELLLYRKDGSSSWFSLSLDPLRDEHGSATHFVCVLTDVSERRRLERQFRHAQKMEAIGRLAGGVAHDFNNILTVIMGFSEFLLRGLTPDSPLAQGLGEIFRAGERAAGLTQQLLAFSRQQVLEPRRIQLNELIHEMRKMLRRLIGEDIELTLDLDPNLAEIRADPGQIDQVVMNLAVNARDAMPRGGRLTITTRNVLVDDDFVREHHGAGVGGPYVRLNITDTGCGMSRDVLAHLFEPFFTTKEQGKGTGLGLATVYGIVQQSGGFLTVFSQVGQGSTFSVYLPQAREFVGERTRPSRSGISSPLGSETILLVEDDDSLRILTRMLLVQQGYRIIEAKSANEALAVSDEVLARVDLLVSDIVLPGRSGLEIAQALRQRKPDLRELFISGYADDTLGRHGVVPTDTAFLKKPFSMAALARKVREVLGPN